MKYGILGGLFCILVNIDSNLKNEWDCCKGGMKKSVVSNNNVLRILLELNWEYNIE